MSSSFHDHPQYRPTWSVSGWVVERIGDGKKVGLRRRNGRRALTLTSNDDKVVHGNYDMALALALALDAQHVNP